ncbi:HIT family protein [Halopseudomonas maritima]|uniref:HIT family protein n=1 Tax=Halopseudomonas maritima TaxID=2918528 RepID=UPI001EEA70F6|nr:HIT family protein [Halopseudomonas maritima]UJJ32586.1 HIT family protein [Halopseudomonas maritima]
MKKCIFCDIAHKTSPAHKVWEDEDHLAFLSIYPNTEGVTVVIPKKHYPSYAFAVPEDVLVKLIQASRQVALLLDSALENVARTGLVLEGYGVDHLHAKLFPMHNTGKDSTFKLIKSDVEKFFDKYEGYLSSHDGKRADEDALASLAAYIRSCS